MAVVSSVSLVAISGDLEIGEAGQCGEAVPTPTG